MRWLLILLVKVYQRTLSPDHGLLRWLYPHGFCKFYPTCSSYTLSCLSQYGSIKGSAMAMQRIARCNPWTKGGIDLPS